jgi:putative RecB family exonuclease
MLTLPRSLSPSKVASFGTCALAFRFSVIEHLPEPTSPAMLKGTLVHAALERLFWEHPAGHRSEAAAQDTLATSWAELQEDPELLALGLSEAEAVTFLSDAQKLVANYFQLEDPNDVRTVGMELTLEAKVGDVRLRGIIDRLDLNEDGELVVVDYKTGRAPSKAYEQTKMGGVHFYALLCEQVLGRRPVEVRLLHLKEPVVITASPTEQSLQGHRQRTLAVWSAIERACSTGDFRPRPSPLCNYCHFKPYCPAHGGDPDQAAVALLPRDASSSPGTASVGSG